MSQTQPGDLITRPLREDERATQVVRIVTLRVVAAIAGPLVIAVIAAGLAQWREMAVQTALLQSMADKIRAAEVRAERDENRHTDNMLRDAASSARIDALAAGQQSLTERVGRLERQQ